MTEMSYHSSRDTRSVKPARVEARMECFGRLLVAVAVALHCRAF